MGGRSTGRFIILYVFINNSAIFPLHSAPHTSLYLPLFILSFSILLWEASWDVWHMEQLPRMKAGLSPNLQRGAKVYPPWDPWGGLEKGKVPSGVALAGSLTTLLPLLMKEEKLAAWESPGLSVHHSYSLWLNCFRFLFLDQYIQMSVGTAQPHLLPLSVLTRNNCFLAGELLPLPVCCREKTAWLT